jgi:single-strand DNA-binding protein
MAGGVNKVILVGNLGADPDMRYTPSGAGVCELRMATNESWSDKNGQRQERTEWHRIVVWGKRAELCAKYLSKGRQCYVEGRLRTRSWEDKEGNKRYTTEIVATDVQFLGGGYEGGPGIERGERGGGGSSERRGGRGGGGGGGDYPPPPEPDGADYGRGDPGPDDDIPF